MIQHRIHTARWNSLTGDLTEWYLKFWADIGLKPSGQQFLIFLNVIYPKVPNQSLVGSFDKAEGGLTKAPYRTGVAPDQWFAVAAGCPRLMLKELLPPKQDEVKDWFSYNNICDSEKIRQELSEKIFKTDDGRIVDYKSMADIEHESAKDLSGVHCPKGGRGFTYEGRQGFSALRRRWCSCQSLKEVFVCLFSRRPLN